MTDKQKSAKKTAARDESPEGWTDDERAAMKEHSRELKAAAARRGKGTQKADAEADLLAKIADMPKADRVMAERLHAIVMDSAPDLTPRTWYGMPAYAKDGKVLCFFQAAAKFKARYATFGFNDSAKLDDGAMWPTSFALKELTASDGAKIATLVKRAAS